MIQFKNIDLAAVVDLFLLLLIGIGPKVAVVPFLQATAGMPKQRPGSAKERRDPLNWPLSLYV